MDIVEIALEDLPAFEIKTIDGGRLELELIKIDEAKGMALLKAKEGDIESIQDKRSTY